MIVKPIKTSTIRAGAMQLVELLNRYLPDDIPDRSVIAITSKVISLCENRVVPVISIAKDQLIKQESDLYIPKSGKYGFTFTVTNNTLIPSAGIDESNGDGNYVLWPSDPQATANSVRDYLTTRFPGRQIGVIVTDSTSTPMRRGTSGICIAHSGFNAFNDYVGKPDLFNRIYRTSKANVSGGLAAAAVVTMGEGTESAPLCLISDIDFVQFQDRPPNSTELEELRISIDDDVFAPFLSAVNWKSGKQPEKPND
jgi:F420-0:gamma-glutamyl ligase